MLSPSKSILPSLFVVKIICLISFLFLVVLVGSDTIARFLYFDLWTTQSNGAKNGRAAVPSWQSGDAESVFVS